MIRTAGKVATFGTSPITHAIQGQFRYDRTDNRTVCGRTGMTGVNSMASGAEIEVTCFACQAGGYRWIVYLHQNGPASMSFDLERVENLDAAKDAFRTYCDSVWTDDCSASLYAYSPEDWDAADDYREIGCPFDYPSYVIERGPRGGVRLVNA